MTDRKTDDAGRVLLAYGALWLSGAGTPAKRAAFVAAQAAFKKATDAAGARLQMDQGPSAYARALETWAPRQ